MKAIILLAAAGAMALVPATLSADPGSSQGSTNGVGWDHFNGPPEGQTGQPFLECGEDGPTPGGAGAAPGGGSAFVQGGNAGSHYAGEQPQNSRNTASVSQYDTACANQPQ